MERGTRVGNGPRHERNEAGVLGMDRGTCVGDGARHACRRATCVGDGARLKCREWDEAQVSGMGRGAMVRNRTRHACREQDEARVSLACRIQQKGRQKGNADDDSLGRGERSAVEGGSGSKE